MVDVGHFYVFIPGFCSGRRLPSLGSSQVCVVIDVDHLYVFIPGFCSGRGLTSLGSSQVFVVVDVGLFSFLCCVFIVFVFALYIFLQCCVPNVARVSGFFIHYCPIGFSNAYSFILLSHI